jgi:PAS domain S-box-containing protein
MYRAAYFEVSSQGHREQLNLYAEALRSASRQIEEKVEELSLLGRIVDIAGHILELEEFHRMFLDILLEESQAENCSLMLVDDIGQRLILKAARGRHDDGTFVDDLGKSGTGFRLGEGIAGQVALGQEVVVIGDVGKDRRFAIRETRFPVGSLLCSPIVFRGKVLGVINLSHSEPDAFDEGTKRVMRILCSSVSSAIGNALTHKRTEEKYKAMFEGVRFPVIIVNPETEKIVDCNRFTEDWLGRGSKELLGTIRLRDIIEPECRNEAARVLDQVVAKKWSGHCEMSFRGKNGRTKIGEIHGAMITHSSGSAVQLTVRDVTERKAMEEKLIGAEKLRALGELSGGVAHDFNNVLAAILGRVELLRRSVADRPQEGEGESHGDVDRGLEIIERAARDGEDTVRRIQEFSRTRTSDSQFEMVDVNELIEHSLEFTKVRWKSEAEAKGLSIRILKDFSPLPPVLGSASELREVFTNLMNNAVDSLPEGGDIAIRTRADGSYVEVEIEDTGVGIPDSIRGRIFDPFFTTKGPQSTGLGMSVCYGIITRHEGAISVDSEEGRGSAFTVRVPIREGEKALEREVNAPAGEGRKAAILVVEDEDAVRTLLSDMLASEGHHVVCASNGKEGLQVFQKDNFDLVFTDLGMPGMSGWEVARSVKSVSPGTPVILVTGWGIQACQEDLMSKGVDAVVSKPFSVDDITTVVHEAVERSTA